VRYTLEGHSARRRSADFYLGAPKQFSGHPVNGVGASLLQLSDPVELAKAVVETFQNSLTSINGWAVEGGVEEVRLAIRFKYDLGERIRVGDRDINLGNAVIEYIESRKRSDDAHVGPPIIWHRDDGKSPPSFDVGHIEALAQLPIFSELWKQQRDLGMATNHPSVEIRDIFDLRSADRASYFLRVGMFMPMRRRKS
jgi:hypothetical protein